MQNKINALSFSFLTVFLMNAFATFFLSQLFSYSTTEILISFAFGLFLGYLALPTFFFFFHQECTIFEYIKKNFSMVGRIVLVFLLLFLTFLIARFLLLWFTLYFKENMSMNLSSVTLEILFLIASFYLAKEGKRAILISGIIFFFLFFFITSLSIFFSFPFVNPEHLYPIAFQAFPKTPLCLSFLFCFVPLFFLLVIPKTMIRNADLYPKYQKKCYLFTSFFLLFKILFFIAILGIPYLRILPYPEIHILKKISLLNFIERVDEIFLLSSFLLNYFVFTFFIYYIRKGISTIFPIRKKNILLFGIYFVLFFSTFFTDENSFLLLLLSFFFYFLLHVFLYLHGKLKKHFVTSALSK